MYCFIIIFKMSGQVNFETPSPLTRPHLSSRRFFLLLIYKYIILLFFFQLYLKTLPVQIEGATYVGARNFYFVSFFFNIIIIIINKKCCIFNFIFSTKQKKHVNKTVILNKNKFLLSDGTILISFFFRDLDLKQNK